MPETEQEVQIGLVFALLFFLIGRMVLAFAFAPSQDRRRQVGVVMVLPALLLLFSSWDF